MENSSSTTGGKRCPAYGRGDAVIRGEQQRVAGRNLREKNGGVDAGRGHHRAAYGGGGGQMNEGEKEIEPHSKMHEEFGAWGIQRRF